MRPALGDVCVGNSTEKRNITVIVESTENLGTQRRSINTDCGIIGHFEMKTRPKEVESLGGHEGHLYNRQNVKQSLGSTSEGY